MERPHVHYFKIMGTEKIKNCPTQIPWPLIAPHEKQAKTNHDQSLETLHRRGGLDVLELYWVLNDKKIDLGQIGAGGARPDYLEHIARLVGLYIKERWCEKHSKKTVEFKSVHLVGDYTSRQRVIATNTPLGFNCLECLETDIKKKLAS